MEHVTIQKMCTSTVEVEILSVSQGTSLGISCSVTDVVMSRNVLRIYQNLANKFGALS